MTLAEVLLQAMKDYGAEEIFGIPGDFALPFFKVIEESRILPLYTLSHEPAVGFAADAAARFHCKPSVAAVTYGAGALNMINPIAAAYAEKSPVIVVSGGPGSADKASGLLLHHQVKTLNSQLQMFKEITCDQIVLDNPKTAPTDIARVLTHCVQQSRPVYIEMPRSHVLLPCDPVPPLVAKPNVDQDALDTCVDEVLAQINSATSPALLAGVEIRRYGLEAQVAKLARKLGIPVATTFMGRGLLCNTEAPLQGTYLGVAGDPSLTALIEESDALLMLGVILADTNFGISSKKIDQRKAILACDGEVILNHHIYPHITLAALITALNERVADKGNTYTVAKPQYPRGLIADKQAITPTDIATAVNDMFERTSLMPIAADVGDCLFTALDIENTELVAPGYYATMGYGVPAGLGVQAATGRRTVIVVGDGAFQMTGWELLNCKRYGWDPIVLVFNNCSWEMLRCFQPESQFNNLDELCFAEIAKVLGGNGYRVSTRLELKDALDTAVTRRGRFQLIEIMLERGVLSGTLSRFVNGLKQQQTKHRKAEYNSASAHDALAKAS